MECDMRLNIGPARQFSFVTRDIHATMRHFAERFGVGPWFYEPRIEFKRNSFRGREVRTVISAGIAYSGPIQFEAIQPLDDQPSVYREFLDKTNDGMQLQHINMWVDDLRDAVDRALTQGYAVVQESTTSLGELYYLSHECYPHICLELSDLGPAKRAIFEKIGAAAANWSGEDPIRKGFPI
jgi:hypothetical protein